MTTNIEILIHINDLIIEHGSIDVSWIHNQTGYEINFIHEACVLLMKKRSTII